MRSFSSFSLGGLKGVQARIFQMDLLLLSGMDFLIFLYVSRRSDCPVGRLVSFLFREPRKTSHRNAGVSAVEDREPRVSARSAEKNFLFAVLRVVLRFREEFFRDGLRAPDEVDLRV